MINRLLGIIYILMNRGMVTAAELAEHFEVSVRTIYRDIDSLSLAGIPVYARKGKNGGICLTEQFVLNKMLITEAEQQQILSALVCVRETGAQEGENTLQKLGDFFKTEPVNWLAIDLSDWSGTRKQLYEDIKQAILMRKIISFDYYGQNREMGRRTVEPVQLLFKEYTWYLNAYCRERQAMRLFKLFRMKRLEVSEETFPLREVREQEQQAEKHGMDFPVSLPAEITLWIDKKEAYKVYDRFEESELEELADGNFIVHMHYYPDEWVYGLILSFGASAKVLAPEEVKREISDRVKMMLEYYQ